MSITLSGRPIVNVLQLFISI